MRWTSPRLVGLLGALLVLVGGALVAVGLLVLSALGGWGYGRGGSGTGHAG